ncbi:hypothetical protein Tco_1183214 [Tanacetum coccineum]
MCTYLKNMEGWKPKSLKSNSKKAKVVEESSKKTEAEIAQESSSRRAGEVVEQENSKKQKLEEDKESEELKQCLEIILDDGDDVTINATPLSTKSPTISMLFYLLVEKMYPLTKNTLHHMFNDVKLQVDYECEMAYDLLRLVKKQLKEGYVPK